MAQVVVDLGDDAVRLGEQATVFGPAPPGARTVAEWAEWSGTLPREVLTGLGARVRRIHAQAPSLRCVR